NSEFHRRDTTDIADEGTPARYRQRQWAVGSVKVAVAALVVLQADEIRQHVGPRPADAAGFAPGVVIFGLATNGEQTVHRARPAQHLAARPADSSIVELGFRLRPEAPVKPVVADDATCRNTEPQLEIARAGFEKKHTASCIGGQSGRQGTACRTGADDN